MGETENTDRCSFFSVKSYTEAMLETPKRLAERVCAVTTVEEEMTTMKARSGATMHKTLRWYDLIAFGIGGMVGAGVFVTTGQAAREYAGPAIIVSYAIAGVSALLSALCYTEFAVSMPVAGGSFTYLRTTFGEFAAFIVGANLIMEYVFSNAAVARSFTAYLQTAIGVSGTHWRFHVHGLPNNFNELDLPAVVLVLIITSIICYSMKESSWLNMVITAVHVLLLVFIMVMGFVFGDKKNLTTPADPTSAGGFAPYGARGVFNGAAVVYFGYIGYDAVSTMAEEAKNQATDIPIGVSGSVGIVSVIYCLLATSLVWLVPYDVIDGEAPFPRAFKRVERNMGWVSNVVGAVAAMGILTSLMVAMIGQSRYMCVIGRSHVVPQWFAKVHPTTGTPLHSTIALGVTTSVIAMFTDLAVLVNLISIGTLLVFYMVAAALVYRRYAMETTITTTTKKRGDIKRWPTVAYLVGLSAASVAFSCFWQSDTSSRLWGLILSGTCTLFLTWAFSVAVVPAWETPAQAWSVPMMPWIPSFSIFLNVFLLSSLDKASYIRFGVFLGVAVAFYVFYSVHATYDDAHRHSRGATVTDVPLKSVESHV